MDLEQKTKLYVRLDRVAHELSKELPHLDVEKAPPCECCGRDSHRNFPEKKVHAELESAIGRVRKAMQIIADSMDDDLADELAHEERA